MLTEVFRNISGDKTEKLFFPERSRERFSKKNSFSVFQFCLRNYSGTFPETKLKNWKTVFFMENLSLDLSGKNSFSVFQFCLRNSSGTFPETKLKNWKTEKLFFYGESLPGSLWKKQFFSFWVLLTELFRNISGDKTKKLKNWKTVFFMENLSLDVSGKNSFSVFQFCLRNSSGTFPETKLKNWKTEKLFFYGESLPGWLWKKKVFQFFSFAYGSIPEHTTFFSRAVYVIYFYIWARYVTPQTKLTKSRGQNVPETL